MDSSYNEFKREKLYGLLGCGHVAACAITCAGTPTLFHTTSWTLSSFNSTANTATPLALT
jgi:hypothetical protein